jgi:hypothetical protein
MPHIRVNPEIKAKTAVCERSQTYRLDGHASRDAQLRVLEPSADPAWSLCWALPMAFEIPMPDNDPRRIGERIACYALFTDPPLARVGASEAEVRASGRPALRAKMPMPRVGRARESGETQGFMKVVVDAETRRLLGAAILGMNGDEVIHSLLDMMAAGQPVDRIARTVHIHPTVSELVPTLLQQLKPMV